MTKEEKFKLLELICAYSQISYELGKRAGQCNSDLETAFELHNKQHNIFQQIKGVLDEQT